MQQTPEVFENKSPAPPSSTHSKGSEVGPPIVAQSLQTTSRTSTPTNEGQTTAREPQIQYTEDNILLEFQGDLLSVYSQSSGTVSYVSFLENFKSISLLLGLICTAPSKLSGQDERRLHTGSCIFRPSYLCFVSRYFAKDPTCR